MKFEIKHRLSARIIFSFETVSFKTCVEAAVRAGVDLSHADLRFAKLSHANLRFAKLSNADLRYAKLRFADLRNADMSYTDLRYTDLGLIKDDFINILSSAPNEVPALIDALKNGEIDGSSYQGDCACLIGTIANARGCDYKNLGTIQPDVSRPAERFFLAIRTGDTPETNQVSRVALEWAEEWLAQRTNNGGDRNESQKDRHGIG